MARRFASAISAGLAFFSCAFAATFTLAIGALAFSTTFAEFSFAWAGGLALAFAISAAFTTFSRAFTAAFALAFIALAISTAFGTFAA